MWREGGAAEPARPGVGLGAGFVPADLSVAVGNRYGPWGGGGWTRPVPLSCVRAGRGEVFFRVFFLLMLLLCVIVSASGINFLF